MLCLTRHRGEAIVIGQDITVTVLSVIGDKVRLGIEAPQSISVHRQEVADAIARENARSSDPAPLPPASSGGSPSQASPGVV